MRVLVLFSLLGATACDGGPDLGAAAEPWCAGLYAAHVVARPVTLVCVAPECLAQAADGAGPQTLSLSVDRGFTNQVSYQTSPSLSRSKNDITRAVQSAIGFTLSASVDLVASSAVLVPTGAYYRLEAYPEYQVLDWDLRADACSVYPDTLLTRGSVYRPVGIHFRVMVLVSGAWNALAPPSPNEVGRAPWGPAGGQTGADPPPGDAGAPPGDAGAPDAH